MNEANEIVKHWLKSNDNQNVTDLIEELYSYGFSEYEVVQASINASEI